jgi:hypothetical protein
MFNSEGGDRLKFGDVIIAVASMTVVLWLVDTVLSFALVPMNPAWGGYVADVVSALVSPLIVGYVFAGKIREESRMASICKLVVLFAVATMLIIMIWGADIGHYNAMVDENLTNTYGKTTTSSWTNSVWVAYESMMLNMVVALYIVIALVFGFIGLYLGSMRKPSTKIKG